MTALAGVSLRTHLNGESGDILFDGNPVARIDRHGVGSNGFNFTQATDPVITDPTRVQAYMTWADLKNNLAKRRNAENTAWVVEGELFRPSIGVYASSEIPATDQGPIYVVGVGLMGWSEEVNAYVIESGGGARGGGSDRVFWVNDSVITESFTVKSGERAGSWGPLKVATGVVVTIEPDGVWTIV